MCVCVCTPPPRNPRTVNLRTDLTKGKIRYPDMREMFLRIRLYSMTI